MALFGEMMGLLDNFDDPKTQALLSMGFGLLNSRGNFGQGLGQAGQQAMGTYADARKAQQAQQMQAQQMEVQKQTMQSHALQQQLMQQQVQDSQRAAADRQRQQEFLQGLPSPQMLASGSAMAGGGGPTQAATGRIAPVDPMQQLMFEGLKAGSIPLQSYLTSLHKDTSPVKLGAGEQLLDPKTYKPLANNPKEDAKPELSKLISLRDTIPAGHPDREIVNNAIRKSTTHAQPTRVNVNTGQRFENAYSTDQGKQFSDTMAGINKTAFAAPSQIRKLERMEALLDGVDGGKLSPGSLEIASMANSVGIKMDPKLGNKEASQALAREIAGGFRQPGTGPMTDKDFENFLLQVPDLSKSAAGRKQITTTMKSALTRDLQVAKLAREYERQNGKLDNGFLDQAAQYIAENPVVGMPAGWKVR